ncbi:hypothetical protein ACLBWH_01710 [Sphingomonas sp. M6A6_1c]|nr:MAG: hypothetical protein EOO77_10510 [Oxalobacteraceae bacterium]
MRRALVWCLVYFWTAAAALAINSAAGWQYDGDFGWWLVTAYSSPALALASPMFTLGSNDDLGAAYSLLFLAVLTVASAVFLRRSRQPANVR